MSVRATPLRYFRMGRHSLVLMTVEYDFQIVGTLFDEDTANKWYDYDPERQK